MPGHGAPRCCPGAAGRQPVVKPSDLPAGPRVVDHAAKLVDVLDHQGAAGALQQALALELLQFAGHRLAMGADPRGDLGVGRRRRDARGRRPG